MDRPLKILLVVTLSELGGAQKVVYHIAAGLDARLFDVTVACAPGGELVRWLKEPGRAGTPANVPTAPLRLPVRVVEIPELRRDISPVNDLIALRRLFRLIRQERFDTVHCNSTKAGVIGRLAAWLAGAPRIFFTAHGWGINEYQSGAFRCFSILAERLAGALSTRVVCVSRFDYEKALALKLVRPEKLALIHNGVPDPAPGRPGKGRLRAELGLAGGDLLIGSVMRLAPPKEPLFLLEAARRLAERPDSPGCYVALIGDGPLRAECEVFVREHNLEARVFFLGAREDAAELVAECDLFTHFSRWEGLPLVIIEAMLAGVPVVANAVGGVGELVAEGETGFLLAGLNAGEAESACARLLSDVGLRRRMGEAGRRRARQLFSLREMLRLYQELYWENLSAR